MAQIGLKNLFAAEITEDADGNETYGSPFRLAKAINADMQVNSSNAVLYADDGADVDIKEFTDGTLTLGINDLENGVAARLLDAAVDVNGVLVSTSEDQPKPVAVGFQSRSAKGGDRFFWLYRVTFAIPNAALNTKGNGVEFATPSIVGTISRRNKVDANGKHPWKAEVKGGDAGVSASVISGWFGGVYEPGQTANLALSALTIGTKTLTPAFSADVLEYTLATTTASETVTATASGAGSAVAITVNGTSYASGDSITWETGVNDVVVRVSNGSASRTYHVTVTKS